MGWCCVVNATWNGSMYSVRTQHMQGDHISYSGVNALARVKEHKCGCDRNLDKAITNQKKQIAVSSLTTKA